MHACDREFPIKGDKRVYAALKDAAANADYNG